MNYILLIAMILSAASALFSLTRQFQMLQQNSYFPSRYFGWLKDSFAVILAVLSILFCASSVLYTSEKYTEQGVLIAFILGFRIVSAVNIQKKSIKKLVFTSRVKRLYAAAAAIMLIFILLYCLFPETLTGEIGVILLFMLSVVTPLLTFLCWAVTLPFEKAFAAAYVRDAKRILKECPDLTVIGITGSYGKTTTKFILKRILSEKYNVVATPKSFNTPMGVVRTVREQIQPQTQVFICEMGAKNIGDIKELCDIADPDYGIITAVGPQHLDTFKSVDNVFKTKFELSDAVKAKNGEVFVNGDCAEITNRIDKNGYILCGTAESCEFRAENISYSRYGSSFDLCLGGERVGVTTRLLGTHSINDIVIAAACAYRLGVSVKDIAFAISSLKPTEHRLELKSYGKAVLIDDAYNANPEGSLGAVRVLGSFEGMRKIIVTPGLIELGEREYESNYALGLEAAKYCDIIILVGKNRSRPLRDGVEAADFDSKNVYVVSSFKEAMAVFTPLADSNTVILLENDLPDNYLN